MSSCTASPTLSQKAVGAPTPPLSLPPHPTPPPHAAWPGLLSTGDIFHNFHGKLNFPFSLGDCLLLLAEMPSGGVPPSPAHELGTSLRLELWFGMQYWHDAGTQKQSLAQRPSSHLHLQPSALPQVLQDPHWAIEACPLSHPIRSIPFCPSQMLPMADVGRLGRGAAVCLGSLPVWISPP